MDIRIIHIQKKTKTFLLEDWMRILRHCMRTIKLNHFKKNMLFVELFYIVLSLNGTVIGYLGRLYALYVKLLFPKVIQYF